MSLFLTKTAFISDFFFKTVILIFLQFDSCFLKHFKIEFIQIQS